MFRSIEIYEKIFFPVTKGRKLRERDVTLVKEQGNLQNGNVFFTGDCERMEGVSIDCQSASWVFLKIN